ncbi:hypothetical protein [Pseudoalteromonas xiamenensis]
MIVFLNEIFGLTLGALTIWGFLMALFVNTLVHCLSNQKRFASIIASAIMFISYFLADQTFFLTADSSIFLNWFIFDTVTIVVLVTSLKIFKQNLNVACCYVLIGLCLSTVLLLSMYIDTYINQNEQAWWLWDTYVFGGTIIDFSMIAALILNRDFLKFSFIKSLFTKKSTVELPSLK